ncbi:MAG: (deoxy)nucleoside triphosphate pyrophosphohydrolase [Vicinamibacterales bacterium]
MSAAVIERDDRFLLTRRLDGTHLAGRWEFPGGKCESGESLSACLEREILEELAVGVEVGTLVFEIEHDYADRRVRLHFFACTLLGDPVPQLGQEMRWVPRAQLPSLDLPDADRGLIERLTHPAARARD